VTRDGPEYAVYAVRYAHKERRRPDNFFNGDPHDAPMPMDYFVWAVVGGGRTWIVDTGFDKADAEARGRTLYRNAKEALALIDIDAARVEDVIITHLHYDHVGGFAHFPAARFHLQDDEMAFATGRHMTSAVLNRAYTADHVANLVYEVYKGRVVFHAGDAELAPGLSVHHVGGHTKGLQVVRARTRVGWLVLASDATHYYENMETCRPYATAYDLGAMVEAFRRLNELAESPDHIVPGHDPLVMERYPPVSDDLEGIAVRLDVERSG
jgi:glyoxylase-like metal-dependent hydrolase (beta-lactamase superfamily II)